MTCPVRLCRGLLQRRASSHILTHSARDREMHAGGRGGRGDRTGTVGRCYGRKTRSRNASGTWKLGPSGADQAA